MEKSRWWPLRSGKIPDAMASMTSLLRFGIETNRLSGTIPDAVAPLTLLQEMCFQTNWFSGTIPDAMSSLSESWQIVFQTNCLSGNIPDALSSATSLAFLSFSNNMLSGTIPIAVASLMRLTSFYACANKLSGSIPEGLTCEFPMRYFVKPHLSDNRLTGSLPSLKIVVMLMVSGNLLEGTLPNVVNPMLGFFVLSGEVGRSGGLKGPLPSTLCQASELQILTIANQQMEGEIQSLTSTLSLLALHKNRFKIFSNVHLANSTSKTMVLLHDNLLSCSIPWCGNASAKSSITAIGNQFRHPNREFPVWLSEYEHDPLFWISGSEGKFLLKKISGAVGFFIVAVAGKLGSAGLLRAMSEWQSGPPTHLWIVEASSHLICHMANGSTFVAVFMMFLLFWDRYVCPPTLAMASACLRSSSLIRTSAFLLWCKCAFHSVAVDHMTMQGKGMKEQWTKKMFRKRLLLWLLWCVLTVVLSIPAILNQVSKSIPGFLPADKVLSLGLNAFVGVIQGLVSSCIVPYLASKVTWGKHTFTTVSNLIMNCFIPTVIIMYLDTGSF